MPLFMDIHRNVDNLKSTELKKAHEADLKVQQKHGVKYLKYWYNEGEGTVFCLVDAPNEEAASTVHREAHGLVADEIISVKEGI